MNARRARVYAYVAGFLSSFSASSSSSSRIRASATSIRIWCARGEVRRLRKFCAYRGHSVREKAVVERAQLFVPPREPPVLCDKPRASHARSILGGHRIQPRGRAPPLLLLLLLAFSPISNCFVSIIRYKNLHLVSKSLEISIFTSGNETWNYREIKAGRERCE